MSLHLGRKQEGDTEQTERTGVEGQAPVCMEDAGTGVPDPPRSAAP